MVKKGCLRYFGHIDNVNEVMAQSHIIVHPSYHEGLSNVLLQEAACARPVLAGKINGCIENRLPGNSNISFKDINAATLVLELDNKGICASSGSACSSGDSMPSHVLTAIGLNSNLSRGALRVTFGDFNTKEEVDYLIANLKEIINKLRKNSSIN